MKKIIDAFAAVFDKMEMVWVSERYTRWTGNLIVLSFLISLGLIHLKIYGYLPEFLHSIIPSNHFEAIEVAFVLLLFFEIQSLVLVLPKSFAGSLLKQFEILSLILLRQAFKEFKYLEEPLDWSGISDNIYHMMADAAGAILIFGGILILKNIQKHRAFTENKKDVNRFISIKKTLSIILSVIFIFLTFDSILWFFGHKETTNFFSEFYTVLIFSDIFIVLVSLRYSLSYIVLFRNSGFAFITVIIRIALSSPVYINAVLGVVSIVFAIVLTFIYSNYSMENKKIENQ